MPPLNPDDLLHKVVWSGLGEEIGVVVHVDRTTDGLPRRLWIREQGADPSAPVHRVKCTFIRTVATDGITLKGPREGFHITRIGHPVAPQPSARKAQIPVDSGIVPMDTYARREFLR